MHYEKFAKIGAFIRSIEGSNSYLSRHVEQISTGNLSHHKAAMSAEIKQMDKEFEEIKPFLEELKEELRELKE